jgi:hypothetical protein
MKPSVPQRTEPQPWSLESSSADDPQLPKPRGERLSKKPVQESEFELCRLKNTHRFGGLMKERWIWHGGQPEFYAYVWPKQDNN